MSVGPINKTSEVSEALKYLESSEKITYPDLSGLYSSEYANSQIDDNSFLNNPPVSSDPDKKFYLEKPIKEPLEEAKPSEVINKNQGSSEKIQSKWNTSKKYLSTVSNKTKGILRKTTKIGTFPGLFKSKKEDPAVKNIIDLYELVLKAPLQDLNLDFFKESKPIFDKYKVFEIDKVAKGPLKSKYQNLCKEREIFIQKNDHDIVQILKFLDQHSEIDRKKLVALQTNPGSYESSELLNSLPHLTDQQNKISNALQKIQTEISKMQVEIVKEQNKKDICENKSDVNDRINSIILKIIKSVMEEKNQELIERLASYDEQITSIMQNPKIQQLPKEKINALEKILKNVFLDNLMNLKGSEYRGFLENYGRALPSIFQDFSDWYNFIFNSLDLPSNENQKTIIFKKVLECGFGTSIDLARYMDGIMDGMQVSNQDKSALKMEKVEDYIAKGNIQKIQQEMINKWQALGWVFNQISDHPLPYNLEVPYYIVPLLFSPSAPPLDSITDDSNERKASK